MFSGCLLKEQIPENKIFASYELTSYSFTISAKAEVGIYYFLNTKYITLNQDYQNHLHLNFLEYKCPNVTGLN